MSEDFQGDVAGRHRGRRPGDDGQKVKRRLQAQSAAHTTPGRQRTHPRNPSERARRCGHLDFRLPVSRTVRHYGSVFFN